MITAQDEGDRQIAATLDNQCLERLFCVDFEKRAQLGDGVHIGGSDFRHSLLGIGPFTRHRRQVHLFYIGCVSARGAERDGIFAGLGQHVELMGVITPNTSAVCFDCLCLKPQPFKDPYIGVIHGLVAL